MPDGILLAFIPAKIRIRKQLVGLMGILCSQPSSGVNQNHHRRFMVDMFPGVPYSPEKHSRKKVLYVKMAFTPYPDVAGFCNSCTG
jgi:hypothetical protein